MELFGVKLVGVSLESGRKVALTLGLVVVLLVVRWVVARLSRRLRHESASQRVRFWTRQGLNLVTAGLILLGTLSIWFNNPAHLAAGAGVVTVGLAFALQRVIVAVAGYFTILIGKNFTVGERIAMGGVRGDVIDIGFLQTTIMEMGQPAPERSANPEMWVRSLQFTGRVVSVSNALVFDEPVYNYSRDFPYIWDEITVPIPYSTDHASAERILLAAARERTVQLRDVGTTALRTMRRRYFLPATELRPRVYYRMTDNWLELTVRFIVDVRGVRDFKDRLTREILDGLEDAGIPVASATFEVVGWPRLEVTPSSFGEGQAPMPPSQP
ncbi:MAG: mechanosensitive ion channel family protein [Dehalococcoidia bacterium]